MIDRPRPNASQLRTSAPMPAHSERDRSPAMATPSAPANDFEIRCCEQFDRIHEQLDGVGTLLQELLQAVGSQEIPRDWYSTQEVARILGKRPFTVREWCRLGRVQAQRALSGRGADKEWRVSHAELIRIQNEGLLPRPRHY